MVALCPMILAEVADKLPSLPTVLFVAIAACAGMIFVAQRQRKLLPIAIVISAFWYLLTAREFVGDDFFRSAASSELGKGYLAYILLMSVLPLVMGLIVILLGRKSSMPI